MGGEDVELEREFVAYPDSRTVLRLDNEKTFLHIPFSPNFFTIPAYRAYSSAAADRMKKYY